MRGVGLQQAAASGHRCGEFGEVDHHRLQLGVPVGEAVSKPPHARGGLPQGLGQPHLLIVA
jgi:hypothetical protein